MMTKLNLMKPILAAVCTALLSFSLSAQVVKNDRLLSFEQPELPAGLSATKGTLGISDQHYKDGTHSLRWTFDPGSVLKTLPEKTLIFPLLSFGCTIQRPRILLLSLNS